MFGRPAWLLAVKFDSCRTCYHPFILIVSKFLFWFLNPNWVLLQNILWITFTPLYLQLHIDHSVLQTVLFFLFRELGPLYMAQTRSFATIGPSLWNALPSSYRLTLLSGSRSASLSLLKTYLYSQGLRTGSATEWSLL